MSSRPVGEECSQELLELERSRLLARPEAVASTGIYQAPVICVFVGLSESHEFGRKRCQGITAQMIHNSSVARPEILAIPGVDAGNDEPATDDPHAPGIIDIGPRGLIEEPFYIPSGERDGLQLRT